MITINNKDYAVKPTIRAMIIFESIMNKSYDSTLATHNVIYFYSVVMAAAPDSGLTLDEFYDAIDADPTLITRISEEINRYRLPIDDDAKEGGAASKK